MASSSTSQPLNAQTLVVLLARLQHLALPTVARIAGAPTKNLMAWLNGKPKALRLRSMVAILQTLGIRIDRLRTVLDSQRVHFWDIKLPLLGPPKAAYAPLMALSKLLTGGLITEVRPVGRQGWLSRRVRRYFLVYGQGPMAMPYHIVVCVRQGLLGRGRITPDIIKGALWRDDSDAHCVPVGAENWHALQARDMTVQEYVQIFECRKQGATWNDVGLMAREYHLTANDVVDWMVQSHSEGGEEQATEAVEKVQLKLGRFADAA